VSVFMFPCGKGAVIDYKHLAKVKKKNLNDVPRTYFSIIRYYVMTVMEITLCYGLYYTVGLLAWMKQRFRNLKYDQTFACALRQMT